MRNASSLFSSVAAISAALMIGVVAPQVRADKPDPHKPVHATDTVLVKKVTLKGKPGGGGGGGKTVTGAATGVLAQPCAGIKRALVVGISLYPEPQNQLVYADDDAVTMADALRTVYGFADVTLLTNMNATRAAILTEIDALESRSTADDEVVFFFSGHGMNGIADDGDAERKDEAICAHDGAHIVPIWDGELAQAFAGFSTSRIAFVFDSCLCGGMTDLQAPGRVILMACGETGYSYEGDQWAHGEFTYYMVLKGINEGRANTHDYDADTLLSEPAQVTVEEAFDYTKANCQYDRPVIFDSCTGDLLP